MTQPEPPLPPPGWHPDPSGRHELRYWDGSRWSEHVSDWGRAGLDDLSAPTAEAAGQPEVQPERAPESDPAAASPGLGEPPPSVPTVTGMALPHPAAPGYGGPWVGAVPETRSLAGLATSLTVVLWVTVAVAALGMFASANRAAVAGDILDFDFSRGGFAALYDLQNRSDDADRYVGIAVMLMLACSVAILVLLIVWMWRVAKNAQLSGRVQPRFGPGWTIGGWFVPVANLVIPVLVMQDLWRASDPATPPGHPEWRRAQGSALVGWWWAAYLVSSFRFGGGGEASSRSELETLRTLDSLAAMGAAAAIAAAVLLIFVVRGITRRQEMLLAGGRATPA